MGSKDMIKKPKTLGIFGKSHFFGRKSLNRSNLVKTYRNSIHFFRKIFKIKQGTRIRC